MKFFFSVLQNMLLYSQDNYFISILFFFLFLLCYSIFSLPGLIIFTSISGYLFGIYYGFIISILSVTLGSLAFFFLSKIFFKYFFIEYYEKYTQNINQYISHSTLEYLIIFRLIIGPPLMLQNLILSFLEISNFRFILSTFIGLLPTVLFSTLIGNKLNNLASVNAITAKNIFTLDLLLILLSFILIMSVRIYFKKRRTK